MGNESDVADIIFRYWQRNPFVLHCFERWWIAHDNSVTEYPTLIGFASKCTIFQLVNRCKISLDHVTFITTFPMTTFSCYRYATRMPVERLQPYQIRLYYLIPQINVLNLDSPRVYSCWWTIIFAVCFENVLPACWFKGILWDFSSLHLKRLLS